MKNFIEKIRDFILRKGIARKAADFIFPGRVILTEYPYHTKTRWDVHRPHRGLWNLINANRSLYAHHLQSFLAYQESLTHIPVKDLGSLDASSPCWLNDWLPALDSVAIYCFIAKNMPKLYLEVGSGNSTKFAARAVRDHQLNTKIISIDPSPRADIDPLCCEVIRKPLEDINLDLFDRLGMNDILYIDSSHRVLQNSDVTALFLEVIPRLKSGVIVEIHDIYLPYDYPAEIHDRHYSEQYLLAALLLAGCDKFEVIFPGIFISQDNDLKTILSPLWQNEKMRGAETHGCSFWLRIK